ncbi:MAG: hypothetical protein ACYT04_80475, partial [Nostoc sp.]
MQRRWKNEADKGLPKNKSSQIISTFVGVYCNTPRRWDIFQLEVPEREGCPIGQGEVLEDFWVA